MWQALFAEVYARIVTCRWVRGHGDDVFNNRADALASQGLKLNIGERYVRYFESIEPKKNVCELSTNPNLQLGEKVEAFAQMLRGASAEVVDLIISQGTAILKLSTDVQLSK